MHLHDLGKAGVESLRDNTARKMYCAYLLQSQNAARTCIIQVREAGLGPSL